MKLNTWLWLIGLLLLSGTVHAEGGCPPGQYPITGQGWQTCNPIPGYAQNQGQAATAQPQQQPPERWQDHWGAIATYISNGSVGMVTNLPSQSSAENAALVDYQSKHGSTCRIELSYRNQCAAFVVGDKGYNTNASTSIDEATRKGMQICTNAGHSNCHVLYSACSMPVRIQ
jgi:hypothetical protein